MRIIIETTKKRIKRIKELHEAEKNILEKEKKVLEINTETKAGLLNIYKQDEVRKDERIKELDELVEKLSIENKQLIKENYQNRGLQISN